MAELTTAERVVALLEWGDVAEVDELIAGSDADLATGENPAEAALWRGMRALMEGRFLACERFAAEVVASGSLAGPLLMAALRREQERLGEAEAILRSLIADHPLVPEGAHALLPLIVGEMGRDGLARQELARLLPVEPVPLLRLAPLFLLGELAATVAAPDADLDLLYRRLAGRAGDYAVEEGGAVFYGAVSLALGRLAQAQGHWNDAVEHYWEAVEAHRRVGAPLLLAHTQRHLAALLRLRDEDDDWEDAVELLSSAVAVYRQLGVEGLATAGQAVLAKADDVRDGSVTGEQLTFRVQGDVWLVGPIAQPARVRDARGLRDIARLLSAPRSSLHVSDLVAWTGAGLAPVAVDDATRHEYEARIAELAGEQVEAERAGDGVRAALARAERDLLVAALVEGFGADPLDAARRAVATRIRISLDHIEAAAPDVGRHLRAAIRTGTFCSYEPDRPVRWQL